MVPLAKEGQLLTAGFDYHSQKVSETQLPDGTYVSHSKQRMVIRPGVVKQVIEYGLKVGWKPNQRDKQLDLGYLDNMIDLKLE